MSDSTFGLEAEILEALRRINRAIEVRSRTLLLNYGLTAPQLTVLQAVARQEPVTPAALSREVHLGRPTVTGILNRLELRALIRRTKEGEDRRSVHIRLTEAGRRMLAGAPSVLRVDFQKKLASLKDWERTQILASLQRLADMMDVRSLEESEIYTEELVDQARTAAAATISDEFGYEASDAAGSTEAPAPTSTPDGASRRST
jgi:DNA-binding MarR family transcriptional regulator